MELREALRRRRMVRSFQPRPVDAAVVVGLCEEALRSPTAGNSAGVRFTVLAGGAVSRYFDAATDAAWREENRRAPGLLRAGAVVVATGSPSAYTDRYSESDKSKSGLENRENWPVPYWQTDAAMATMSLLLLLEEAGLQATMWGNFRHDQRVLDLIGARDEQLVASVIIGYRDEEGDFRSPSLDRATPTRAERVRLLTL